jgi:hypothetical protein
MGSGKRGARLAGAGCEFLDRFGWIDPVGQPEALPPDLRDICDQKKGWFHHFEGIF